MRLAVAFENDSISFCPKSKERLDAMAKELKPHLALQIQGIRHAYENTGILRDLDLTLSPGEYCVVLGKSGGGKSTLLRIIAGLLQAASGKTRINGIDVENTVAKDRDVALLFQDDRLYPHWSIRRTLELADQRSPLFDPLDKAVDSLADRFEIGDILNRRPDEVSGGQLRRAALAKAILRRPAIALLDEPLHGLDAGLREHVVTMLTDFPTDRGDQLPSTAILHVTHDGDEAMRLGDQIAVLDGGRIVQKGTPSDIYYRPQSIAVADALGQPPANRMKCNQFIAVVNCADELLKSRSLEFKTDDWVLIRPESIAIEQTLDNAIASNRVTWDVRWVSTRLVAGRWLSHWVRGDQTWVTITESDPESIRNEAGEVELSVAFEDLIWVT